MSRNRTHNGTRTSTPERSSLSHVGLVLLKRTIIYLTDVAIGAPWEDGGKGAVYIFKGSKTGLGKQHVQKIVVKDTKAFGISISGGYDINKDNCNGMYT